MASTTTLVIIGRLKSTRTFEGDWSVAPEVETKVDSDGPKKVVEEEKRDAKKDNLGFNYIVTHGM